MPDCCAYDEVFSSKAARRDLRRYRKRGLDPVARSLVRFLTGAGIAGRTVLEVGGGVGAIHVELLEAGAASVVGVEMSSRYEQAAAELLEDRGFSERVERKVLDFAASREQVLPAEAVVLHRVICCYPDMPALMAAAVEKAEWWLAVSFPRPRLAVRLGLRLVNLINRLRRLDFRVFVHSPSSVVTLAQSLGLGIAFSTQTYAWQGLIFERAS